MKKLLSAILAMIMLLTMLPIGTSAAETGNSERDELIALACEVFPEYAEKIHGDGLSTSGNTSRTISAPELIKEETRCISDSNKITYSEFSDGSVYITNSNLNLWYMTDNSVSDNSTTTVYTGHIAITCNFNGDAYICIKNLKFALVNGGNDYIISGGYIDARYELTYFSGPHTIRSTEINSSQPAKIYYDLHINDPADGDSDPFNVYFSVGNNTYSTSYIAT
ncbi:MAG: hypothetical protein IJB59_02655 [Oscillospiraceae bacterium]|nr:hypothetical protein [Oscillospiraceae bacterium]